MSGKASEACEEVLGDRARPAMLLMQGEGGGRGGQTFGSTIVVVVTRPRFPLVPHSRYGDTYVSSLVVLLLSGTIFCFE